LPISLPSSLHLSSSSSRDHRDLHSFPTRRSSDLSGSSPVMRNPTTCGMSMDTGCPSIAASASIPPTPQPSTPSPLTIVVCESVPDRKSTRLNSSHVKISYAVFCLKKKNNKLDELM